MTDKVGLRVDRLEAARKNLGWSQRELARRCGFSDALIRRYETGVSDPTGYSLKMLAERLDLSTDYLLGLSDDPRGRVDNGQMDETEKAILETYRHEGWAGIARIGVEKLSEK